ncbi:MAG: hypothetical protein GYB64_01770, partial [Chloroflexi bacterium]|nr:hypothetical protein [Chloroflexota bacterium]
NIASAEALTEAINNHFNGGIRAETTARQSGSKVDYLLRTFAPVANDVAPEERPNTDERSIDVLVATGALAEGFNLQDAPVLINYDLSWTVLTLAQRMGRILRPWHEPREIHIYNLIPSTMNDTRIQMALNWRNRLLDRNRQYAAFADIPVMLEETRDKSDRALEMFALATHLTAEQEITLDLDETLRFMERTEGLKTSSFLTDLALIDEKERSRIEGLPAGFRSARETSHSTALFLLLRYRRRPYAALFNRNGDLIYDHEARDRIMDGIRCEEETPLARASLYPTDDEFDQWIERARQAWAEEHKCDARDVTYIAAMALMHAQ